MHGVTGDFIKQNNTRILSGFAMQSRYKPEFTLTNAGCLWQ